MYLRLHVCNDALASMSLLQCISLYVYATMYILLCVCFYATMYMLLPIYVCMREREHNDCSFPYADVLNVVSLYKVLECPRQGKNRPKR